MLKSDFKIKENNNKINFLSTIAYAMSNADNLYFIYVSQMTSAMA